MALNNHDQAQIRDYLLGHLSNEEQQEIEERLMVEDDLFQEFEISKGELVEEYRAGELQQPENSWLKSHYLASPEGRQRLTFVTAVNCLQPARPNQPTWFQRFVAFIKQPRWAIATAAPVASVAAIVLILFFSQTTRTTLSVSLEASTSNRATSNGKYHRITVTQNVGEVKFDLVLPASIAATKYRVDLDDRSGSRRSLNVAGYDPRAVSVAIPATDLPVGLYSLKLIAIKADGAEDRVGEYFFEVVN